MEHNKSYDLDKVNSSVDEEYQRLYHQFHQTWSKELKIVLNRIDASTSLNILDAGCGTGILCQELNQKFPHFTITGLDNEPRMIEKAKSMDTQEQCTFVEGDISNIPFPPNSFDVVFARYVFMHLQYPDKALNELFRILRPKGHLIIFDVYAPLTFGFYPNIDPIVPKVHTIFAEYQKKNGGNREISAILPHLLSSQLFINIEQEVVSINSILVNWDILEIVHNPVLAKPMVDLGLLTAEEYDSYHKVMTDFFKDETSILLFQMYLTLAQKPDNQ